MNTKLYIILVKQYVWCAVNVPNKSNALKIREENVLNLDFSIGGYENLFRQALANGINLFCGTGFSVEAKDKNGNNLPTGEE